MRQPIVTFLLIFSLSSAGTSALARSIDIESGAYGVDCGESRVDVTRELAAHCDGLDTCHYDLAMPSGYFAHERCRARFVAEWSCGAGDLHRAEVQSVHGSGGTLVLTCVPSTGAGK